MKPQPLPAPDKPDETPLLTPAEFRALVVRVRRNSKHYGMLTGCGTFSALIGLILFALRIVWASMGIAGRCVLIFMLVTFGVASLLSLYARRDMREVERLIHFITYTHDANMLGLILDLRDTMAHPGSIHVEIKTAVDEAVLRLLPLVRASNAASLNTSQRRQICSSVWIGKAISGKRGLDNSPYAQGALHALEQVGDKRDLPGIENLLKSYYITEELRSAIHHCADMVAERVAREKDKDVLLRADRKPEAVAMLRAAASDEGNTSA